MPVADPLAVLCALLDRSVTQIAEASADARTFDRGLIIRVSDIWDNSTSPLFAAAVGTKRRHSRRQAAAALLWMADFHREWMVEQAAIAGFALEDSLPPTPFRGPYRDYSGRVQPWPQPLTTDAVEEVAADYDLAASRVISFRAERAGRRLDAHVTIRVPRRFPADTSEPAALAFHLKDVTRVEVAASDLHGAAVTVTDDGPKIALGTRGFVHAASGHLDVTDQAWHESAAGRRADAVVPPGPEEKGHPRPDVVRYDVGRAASRGFAETMREIRVMRYPVLVDLPGVSESCRRYAGAGAILLAAADRRTTRQRAAILRPLTDAAQNPFEPRPKVEPGRRPAVSTAELRMVKYRADHERYGRPVAEELLRHYAVPIPVPIGGLESNDPWRISVLRDPEPHTFAVRTEDFLAGC
ncbi:hypothetical protein Caci_1838 [Catenulispora acidiphila DSM 44928]|uniref:Uncharacterized protein n=1 Tax=Catenulispora acidiphila (strain DSM 44928 / JCM 14897 / NBRC 102108 / NRRL B-24433 / ID139908) TaxID=479433 RepID=C7QD49_CATAD|nr:hypothetical protein [Catenulispora acidiphila]ACU70759.1 hypothetical protein Caci_1838 [Catenulispora acidiphila DSM 44928]